MKYRNDSVIKSPNSFVCNNKINVYFDENYYQEIESDESTNSSSNTIQTKSISPTQTIYPLQHNRKRRNTYNINLIRNSSNLINERSIQLSQLYRSQINSPTF